MGAIDIDAGKVAAYHANFGDPALRQDDIRNLRADDIRGHVDLAWASFPCQDVSVAGIRSGLEGGASGAFWPAWQVIRQMADQGLASAVVAIENVRNLLGSDDGGDFGAVVGSIVAAGYRVGTLMIDAWPFLP